MNDNRPDEADRSETIAYNKLRLIYGMTQIYQDSNGTWWVGSKLRPDLLNMETLRATVDYLDTLPLAMLDNLTKPRGSDSERASLDG